MADIEKTQELGGFEAISNFLVGKGPEGGIESQGDISSTEPPMIDPSTLMSNSKEEEIEEEEVKSEEEEMEEEVIEDKKDTKEDKEKETADSKSTEDLSEFESDITNYLNEEFSKRLGWDLDSENAPSTIEEFVDFMNTIVEESSKPIFANSELEELNTFIQNGGSVRNFYNSTVDSKINLEEVDLEDTSSQKELIREHFKTLGYKEDKINRTLKRYEDAGVLEEEAEDALELLKEYNEETKKKLLESQKNYAETQKQQQQKFISTVEDSIKSIDDVLGVSIPQKEKQELKEYILAADKYGMTGFQKEMLKDVNKFVSAAYYTKKGGSLLTRKQKQGETSAVKTLHKKLNANKGNPGMKSGNQKSGEASDGLSLLSSMLRS